MLLLLADQLREAQTHHTIRFLTTDGEEFNLAGARAYLDRRGKDGSLGRIRASITLDFITQPPGRIHVRCTEDFDGIAKVALAAHRNRRYAYEPDGPIDRDLGCLDARAFEERGISSFYYSPSDPQRIDEDDDSIAMNLQENAKFVCDLILRTDQVLALRPSAPGTRTKP